MFIVDSKIEDYCFANTKPEPQLLAELAKETLAHMDYPQMLTGRIEGRFLKLLVALTGAKNILEIGMFTGYAALSMAEALPADGKIITCEIDSRPEQIAKKYFAQSPHGHKIEIRMGPALETIKSISHELDLVFIDADKRNYSNYYEQTLPKVKKGGLIVVDNALWSGKVVNPNDPDTQAISDLNSKILADKRVENVLLTVRDGINLVRKI